MKWFKHMTASADDEKLAALVGQGGVDGLALYGAYWRFAEIVAKQMEGKTPSCSVTYPLLRWTQLLFTRKSHLGSVLSQLKKAGLLGVEGDPKSDPIITVSMPNLLKYRDEYARKSGQTPDNIPPRTEAEEEEDTEAEDISDATHPHPAKAGKVSPEKAIYDAYPRKEGAGAALKAIRKAVKRLVAGQTQIGRLPLERREAQKLLFRAVNAYARSPSGQQADKTMLPHAATWFNQERWDDDQSNWQRTGGISNGNQGKSAVIAQTANDALGILRAGRMAAAEDFDSGANHAGSGAGRHRQGQDDRVVEGHLD